MSLAAAARREKLSLEDFKRSLTASDNSVSQVEFQLTPDHLKCKETVSRLGACSILA